MTRASQRILDRARASVWRRVGIPVTWDRPVRGRDRDDEGGKNVAAENEEDPGTGRRENGAGVVNHDSTEP